MGVVVVGPSGCGKTVLWKTLQTAMCKIGREVKVYTMNPKALPRHKLLGSIDIDTREWSDGILTYAARQVRTIAASYCRLCRVIIVLRLTT